MILHNINPHIFGHFEGKMGNLLAPTWADSPAVAAGDQISTSLPASSDTKASNNTIVSATSSSCPVSQVPTPNMESVTKTSPTLLRRPSNVFRPMGVSEMEIKSYCTKIKITVGGTKLNVSDNLDFLHAKLSPEAEVLVLNCFENIVMIVERPDALPLEPSALNDLNIAITSLQTNQPHLANQYIEIITKAKKLIESKTMAAVSPESIVQAPLSGRTTPQGYIVHLARPLHIPFHTFSITLSTLSLTTLPRPLHIPLLPI